MSTDYITIPLTKGQETTIDTIDADLADLKWQAHKAHKGYYAARGAGTRKHRSSVYMHRVILERMLGRALIKGEQCDHVDGNKLNNVRSNLRIANNSQNNSNRMIQVNNTSGYKGVYWHKQGKRWAAQIKFQQKHISLGLYDTKEEAYKAYCDAAKEYFGEFYR